MVHAAASMHRASRAIAGADAASACHAQTRPINAPILTAYLRFPGRGLCGARACTLRKQSMDPGDALSNAANKALVSAAPTGSGARWESMDHADSPSHGANRRSGLAGHAGGRACCESMDHADGPSYSAKRGTGFAGQTGGRACCESMEHAADPWHGTKLAPVLPAHNACKAC